MFHSGRAREKLKELYVGDIAGFKPPTTLSPWTSNAHAPARFKVPSQTSRGPYGLVGAAVPFPSGRSISATSYTPLTLVSTKSDDSDEECKVMGGRHFMSCSLFFKILDIDFLSSKQWKCWDKAVSACEASRWRLHSILYTDIVETWLV